MDIHETQCGKETYDEDVDNEVEPLDDAVTSTNT